MATVANPEGLYKVYYFDVRGRCEPLRWVLLVAGEPFEDVRVQPADWMELKPKCPTGTLPIADLPDGRRLGQQFSIFRYLGNVFGLAGKTPLERAQVDSVLEQMDEFGEACRTGGFTTDKSLKRRIIREMDVILPSVFGPLEQMLINNKGGHGWLVGDSLTIADLSFAHWSDENRVLLQLDFDIEWSRWPYLAGLKARVEGHPALKDWIQARVSIEQETENLMAGIAALRSLATTIVNYNR